MAVGFDLAEAPRRKPSLQVGGSTTRKLENRREKMMSRILTTGLVLLASMVLPVQALDEEARLSRPDVEVSQSEVFRLFPDASIKVSNGMKPRLFEAQPEPAGVPATLDVRRLRRIPVPNGLGAILEPGGLGPYIEPGGITSIQFT